MLKKVSVIVPIYKVEKYFKRCIESILNQTYTNIEVILVNDGSPDNCGIMAEHYAEMDDRIRVCHKENGGLSDARNYGMQYITGEYTLFVDSDDWLEKKMIEAMINLAQDFKADVVQSAFFYAHDDHLLYDNRHHSKEDPPTVLGRKQLMSELVQNEKVKNFAWGKLYKTNVIKGVPFKKGVLFEDVFWAHQVMHKVKTYVISHQPMYYYYQRNDSIVANYTVRNLDILEGLKERHHFIEQNYQELTWESYKMILKTSLIHYNLLLANRKKDEQGRYRKTIQQKIKKNHKKFKRAVARDKHLTKQLRLFMLHPYCNVLFLLGCKVIRKLRLSHSPNTMERINL